MARQVGIDPGPDTVIAGVLPAGKVDVVWATAAHGSVVAMIGDGVKRRRRTCPGRPRSRHGGTEHRRGHRGVGPDRGDLCTAADAIHLSRRPQRTIKSNLFWAFAYNVVVLPLAATGLLNPMIAGAVMTFSSVFVVSNSLRLCRFTALAN